MLAEKKKSQKWSQDPRNSFWSKDTTKFGYRMLQRMGWEEGKGLGAREEGRKEHVKIQGNRDNVGLGGKRGRDDDWIEQQDAFDQILAELNAKQDHPTPKCSESKSLLETARQSGRHMYKRFLQSKDLSAATSEDLDCVLGRKRSRQSLDVNQDEESALTVSGITTVTRRQSIQEYFTTKSRHCGTNEEYSRHALHGELTTADSDSRCSDTQHSELSLADSNGRCNDPLLRKVCTKGTKRKKGGRPHVLENEKQPSCSKRTIRRSMKKSGLEICCN